MRDPLHWMSVKRKLALAFGALCLLAFGVGGFLISRSARSALENQIRARIDYQCRAVARALDDQLRLLGRRTEDFASDGFIRERASDLLTCEAGERAAVLRDELRAHLRNNKLPLVGPFVALTIVAPDGRVLVQVDEGQPPDIASIAEPLAAAKGLWHSDVLVDVLADGEGAALQAVSTPLLRIDGTGEVGRLVAWIDPGDWLGAAAGLRPGSGEPDGSAEDVAVWIEDRQGRRLVVPDDPASGVVRVEEGAHSAGRGSMGLFAREVPVQENGWTVHVRQSAVDAFAPVSGLQSRFLAVGLVLATLCGGLLFFPMRFLVRPLGELREAARRIRAGDYAVRVSIQSTDEVGDLARSFNHMAEAVDSQTRRLRTAADALRASEARLRAQHERLDTVIRSLHDGLVVLDPDGRPVLSNAAAAPLVALLDAGSSEGSPRLVSHFLCGEEASADTCASCMTRTGGPPRSCVVDVGSRVLEINAAPLPPDADGRRGRVLVARDVTSRIEGEERDIHRERLSVLGEIAAVMAHELNNPLTSIRMFAQMLADGLPEDSPYREHADVIVRNTETCKHSIRELLGYATASAPEAAPVDVHAVLEDVTRFVRPLAERAGARLETRLDAGDDCVTGDEIQVRQVFVNLIVNALQASESGAVIRVTSRNEEGALVVDVNDSGPGIAPEDRERVFDAFYSTKPRGEGTGLGLPTARRIAELHGGGIELVESRPGSTTFRVRLRAAPAPVAGATP